MRHQAANPSFARRSGQYLLALAAILLAIRLGQLALAPIGPAPVRPPGLGSAQLNSPQSAAGWNRDASDSSANDAAARRDAELAEFYMACPMAAVVDLKTVTTSPEKVDALLPPYRTTADRVPAPGPAVPRIRYPVALRPPTSAESNAAPRAVVRIAQAPAAAATTNTVPPSAADASGEWLIDPNEWYTPQEQGRLQKDATPTATQTPGSKSTPASSPQPNAGWKLVTPEDLESAESGDTKSDPIPPTDEASPPTAESSPSTSEPTPVRDEPARPAIEPIDPSPAAPQAESPEPRDESPRIESPPQPAAEGPADSASDPLAPDELSLPPGGEPAPSAPPVAMPGAGTPESQSPVFGAPPRLPGEEPPSEEPLPPGELPPPADSPASTSPPSPAAAESNLFAPPADAGTSQATTDPNAAQPSGAPANGVDPHLELLARNAYPSARDCAACHEDIYHEWSVSAHAYAAVSPMFHKFEQKLNDLTQGTVGYFCMRCHAPVATDMCASRAEPLWNLPEVAREGVTCIACHRVHYVYGKSNGERRIEPGSVFAPVFGGIGGDGVAETIHRKDYFKVKTSPDETGPGQNIHAEGIYFDPLTRSEFCTPCHQVAVHPGIKLEVVWEQYRASPACKKGIQCQDCHMGRVPGLPLGYNVGPVAKVADKTVNDHRKKSNHIFYGPNYSIAHPGVFPFHLKANRWTMQDWLAFDWRSGWGTEEFEDRVADGEIRVDFPPVWAEADDRYDAREIIDDNLKKLNHKRDIRVEVMENGSHVAGPVFDSPLCRGQDVHFHFDITNTNEGHNLLTASLGAQPQLWANVVLVGPDGRRLWETGYTDSYGDVANIHSIDVRHKRTPYDWQLFNLQTMFLITGAKGTDREFYVPVNVDIDQLPFIRPGAQPISTINHPPFIRMESQSLSPLGSRRVPYRIPGDVVQQPGRYRLSFRMRSRAEPIYFMRFCDATEEMQRSMNEWMIDVHPMSVEFDIR